MRGADLKAWRKHHGYSQSELQMELGVRSRQTISSWENSEEELSRLLQLALAALADLPECRRVFAKRSKRPARTHSV